MLGTHDMILEQIRVLILTSSVSPESHCWRSPTVNFKLYIEILQSHPWIVNKEYSRLKKNNGAKARSASTAVFSVSLVSTPSWVNVMPGVVITPLVEAVGSRCHQSVIPG